jgi:hypothetical protein
MDEHVDKATRAQRDGDPSLEKIPASGLRAEALVDLVGQHQRRDLEDRHTVADRYRVGIVIRPDEFPMAACDSDLYRVVVNAEGEVLDIGRTSRFWTIPIRRAITNRDRGCIFPGCDRPPSWCDAHHCWEWDDGGPTSQDNGCLLCRRHHTFIHKKKWRVVIPKPGGNRSSSRPMVRHSPSSRAGSRAEIRRADARQLLAWQRRRPSPGPSDRSSGVRRSATPAGGALAAPALPREPETHQRESGGSVMAKHVLLVFSNPSEGAEDEYNRWYNEVHLPEVVQTDGFVRAQRFRFDDGASEVVAQRYLAIYEVDVDDVELAKKALNEAAGSYRMSPAFDVKTANVVWSSAVSDVVER